MVPGKENGEAMNDSYNARVQVLEALRRSAGGMTVDDLCEVCVIRSGPGSFKMPAKTARDTLRELVEAGEARKAGRRGRVLLFSAVAPVLRVPLPTGYLYRRQHNATSSYLVIDTPYWSIAGHRMSFTLDGALVQMPVSALSRPAFELFGHRVKKAGFELVASKSFFGDRTYGYVRAGILDLAKVAEWLSKNEPR